MARSESVRERRSITAAESPASPFRRRFARKPRHAHWGRIDVCAVAFLVSAALVLELSLKALSTRPFWYDELWRAYYVSVPRGQFWSQLPHANAPSAAGWMAVTRAFGHFFGWHPYVLRLPELIALPLVGASVYVFARRFTGPLAAFVAAALIGFSGTVLDLGWQLKPYTIELIAAMAVLALWMRAPPPGEGRTIARVGRRTWAGVITLFTVPLAFLIVPLALADVVLAGRGLSRRARAALECAPALVVTGLHSLLFVGRQTNQRNGTFWDPYFVAGRGLSGGLRFIWTQLVDIAGTVPPGVDRGDVNVVHPTLNGTSISTWLVAPAFLFAFVAGALVLRKRRDGQLLLVGLLGGQALVLAASAMRYWPFGPVRTNLFFVPLFTTVAAVGVSDLVRRARRRRSLAVPAAALVGASALALGYAISTIGDLAERRHAPRLLDRLPQAADYVGRLAGPHDLVVVAGRLVRPGWIYSTEVRAGRPPGVRSLAADQTLFVADSGTGAATARLGSANPKPQRILVFSLVIERAAQSEELAELRKAGWCPLAPARVLAGTGKLSLLERCSANPVVRQS